MAPQKESMGSTDWISERWGVDAGGVGEEWPVNMTTTYYGFSKDYLQG